MDNAEGKPQRTPLLWLKGVIGGMVVGLVMLAVGTTVGFSLYYADWENKQGNEGILRIVLSIVLGLLLAYAVAKGLYMSTIHTYSRFLLAYSDDACFWFFGRGNRWWQILLRIITFPILVVLQVPSLLLAHALEWNSPDTAEDFLQHFTEATPCTIELPAMAPPPASDGRKDVPLRNPTQEGNPRSDGLPPALVADTVDTVP